jgi:hypothetical protein
MAGKINRSQAKELHRRLPIFTGSESGCRKSVIYRAITCTCWPNRRIWRSMPSAWKCIIFHATGRENGAGVRTRSCQSMGSTWDLAVIDAPSRSTVLGAGR